MNQRVEGSRKKHRRLRGKTIVQRFSRLAIEGVETEVLQRLRR